jgi:hypothetical protein
MGRYYSGDIEGKFWFALQSSSAADRFGVSGYQPEMSVYNFQEEDLEGVEIEIKAIEEKLGDKLKVITDFFEKNESYNDKMLEENSITKEDVKDFADLELGRKIQNCIKENGECNFEAEW